MTPPVDVFPAPSEARVALDEQYVAAYEQLRRLASSVGRRDARQTLTPTALVHEAWIKLARSPGFAVTSELHFRRIAARAMRQVLVEAARRRLAAKRQDGMQTSLIEFDDETMGLHTPERLLAVDDALTALAAVSARQAVVVEARFFGGLTVDEIAEVTGVSAVTVMRDWRVARAWLNAELAC